MHRLLIYPACCRLAPLRQSARDRRTQRTADTRGCRTANSGEMTEDEFKDWWRRLEKWEAAGGVVNMPPRLCPLEHARH